jgi:hypothetical protein
MIPETAKYEIRIRDVLGEKWATCFAPFMLTTGTKETLLTGVTHDQAELFGVLLKIRDMGLRLVSVTPVDAAEAEVPAGGAETTQEINDIRYT